MKITMFLLIFFLLLDSCSKTKQISQPNEGGAVSTTPTSEASEQPVLISQSPEEENLLSVLIQAEIPQGITDTIMKEVVKDSVFFDTLALATEGDPFLHFLVDKAHPLPKGYEPNDLVPLKNGGAYRINRNDLRLRKEAAESLEQMATAAASEGVVLVASSSYRSYDYQVTVYNRIVRELGQEAADRESAPPGYSQHQTGLVVDFGSIDDSFAQTKASGWLLANGSRFGWSLSFPDGYERITGYRWESWHYRYLGKALCSFTDAYFNGIQQYALRFIHEWERGAYNARSRG
jgi:D-alanyl-D-alanine carboxypeptidase